MAKFANPILTSFQAKPKGVIGIYGDELATVHHFSHMLSHLARQKNYRPATRQLTSEEDLLNLHQEFGTISLFPDPKYFHLIISKAPSKKQIKLLAEVVASVNGEDALVMSFLKVPTKDFMKQLKQWPVNFLHGPRVFPNHRLAWLTSCAQDLGVELNKSQTRSVSDAYEADLFGAYNVLKLCLHSGAESINSWIDESVREYNIFELTDACLAGDRKRSFQIIRSLPTKSHIQALNALARPIHALSTLLIKQSMNPRERSRVLGEISRNENEKRKFDKASARLGTRVLTMVSQLHQLDSSIKGMSQIKSTQALEGLVLEYVR